MPRPRRRHFGDRHPKSRIELLIESAAVQRYLERRSRGTRRALDWRYNSRIYLAIPVMLFGGLMGGVDLIDNNALWMKALGIILIGAVATVVLALARYLGLPVDPASAARLRSYYDDLSFKPEIKAVRRWWRRRRST